MHCTIATAATDAAIAASTASSAHSANVSTTLAAATRVSCPTFAALAPRHAAAIPAAATGTPAAATPFAFAIPAIATCATSCRSLVRRVCTLRVVWDWQVLPLASLVL